MVGPDRSRQIPVGSEIETNLQDLFRFRQQSTRRKIRLSVHAVEILVDIKNGPDILQRPRRMHRDTRAVQEERSLAAPRFPTLDNTCTEEAAMCAGCSGHVHGEQPGPYGPLLQFDRYNSQMVGHVHGKIVGARHRCLDAQFVRTWAQPFDARIIAVIYAGGIYASRT